MYVKKKILKTLARFILFIYLRRRYLHTTPFLPQALWSSFASWEQHIFLPSFFLEPAGRQWDEA